jgi:hypothetical protein
MVPLTSAKRHKELGIHSSVIYLHPDLSFSPATKKPLIRVLGPVVQQTLSSSSVAFGKALSTPPRLTMATEPDTSSAQGQAAAQGPRRLKLVMPNADRARQPNSQSPVRNGHTTGSNKASSGSPERPSYSPVTPTLPEAVLPNVIQQSSTSQDSSQPPEFIEQPDPLPVSLDENPDAIAMRAALSILQMQRQQSLRDMRDLEKLKKAAIKDPEGFVEHLKASKLTAAARDGVDVDYGDDEEEDEDGEDEPAQEARKSESQFPRFPGPQNVVRAPPVEWSKYGIVGEPLDQMHEYQRRHPGATTYNTQPHQIAGPYKPFTDRLNDTKK